MLDERRVAVHSIEGGGRYVDCGIDARGGLLAGLELARICMGDLGQVSIVPGDVGGRAVPLGSGPDRSPCARLPGQPVCGLGPEGWQVLRDGVRADAGRGRDARPFTT